MTAPPRWKLAVRPLAALDSDPPHLADVELGQLDQRRMAHGRRREWLAGRALARRLLVEAGSFKASSVALARAPSGAPQPRIWLDGAWQACGWGASLSHRAGAVAALVWSDDRLGVGIDLERIEPRSEAMIEDFFDPLEQQRLGECGPEERPALAACLWSLKEAGLKALGCGLTVDPRCLLAEPAGGDRWRLSPAGDLAAFAPLAARSVRCGQWAAALAATLGPAPVGPARRVAPGPQFVGSWMARMGTALRRSLAGLANAGEDGR